MMAESRAQAVTVSDSELESWNADQIVAQSYSDAKRVSDRLVGGLATIFDLSQVDRAMAERLVDFVSGAAYGLGGGLRPLRRSVILAVPSVADPPAGEPLGASVSAHVGDRSPDGGEAARSSAGGSSTVDDAGVRSPPGAPAEVGLPGGSPPRGQRQAHHREARKQRRRDARRTELREDRRRALRDERRKDRSADRRKRGLQRMRELAELAPPEPGEREPAIIVHDVHVVYRPFVERRPSLRTALQPWKRTRTREPISALAGVNLTVYRGESLGVIGSNGAGKTTLLRVLGGTLIPDRGHVEALGSVPQLLALGVGFNPKVSGRRNIYLGCLAAGMTRSEIDGAFDEIVEYADLGGAIDRSIETYSSGMNARLAFAVAIRTRPDVLLLDEVLSVGDESFKAKSTAAMEEILDHAGTIVVVSHALPRLLRMCSRLAWLDRGRLIAVGDPMSIVEQYRAHIGIDQGDDDE